MNASQEDTAKESIIEGLWNTDIVPESYVSKEKYQEHLFEQYKISVEMADRISTRRSSTNTFFLTLNTLIITFIGVAWENGLQIQNKWIVVFPLAAVLTLCYLWWALVRSYKQLNTAKYRIIGEFEKKLPSSPYWSAEWKALGEGNDPKLYQELTKIENRIPAIFALLYLVGAIVLIFSK